jgi:hypothetical protein
MSSQWSWSISYPDASQVGGEESEFGGGGERLDYVAGEARVEVELKFKLELELELECGELILVLS